jgi:pyruvate carboxylase
VLVKKATQVQQGDQLIITEAMKMETTVQAPFSGTVEQIYVSDQDAIKQGDSLNGFK